MNTSFFLYTSLIVHTYNYLNKYVHIYLYIYLSKTILIYIYVSPVGHNTTVKAGDIVT